MSKICNLFDKTRNLMIELIYRLMYVCKYAIEDRESFISKVREQIKAESEFISKRDEQRYSDNLHRLAEIDRIFKNLYESYALGIINEDRFKMLSASYETEQKELKE